MPERDFGPDEPWKRPRSARETTEALHLRGGGATPARQPRPPRATMTLPVCASEAAVTRHCPDFGLRVAPAIEANGTGGQNGSHAGSMPDGLIGINDGKELATATLACAIWCRTVRHQLQEKGRPYATSRSSIAARRFASTPSTSAAYV